MFLHAMVCSHSALESFFLFCLEGSPPPHCPRVSLLFLMIYDGPMLVNMSFQVGYVQICPNKGLIVVSERCDAKRRLFLPLSLF
jgi:hypothetical protein